MKKFLRTLILFVVIVGVITTAVNAVYIMQENKKYTMADIKRNPDSVIDNVPSGITVCNFGSSHGMYAFNYENCDGYIGYNFGQPSQSISYDYRILRNYIDNIDEGAIVFITVSHFSLFGPAETSYDNFTALNKRYYKFLPSELIKEYDAKTAFFVKYAPALAAEDISSLFDVLSGVDKTDAWAITADADKMPEFAHRRYLTFVESKCDDKGDRLYNEEEIQAIYDMIALCKEHGLIPVLVTTPYLSEYNNEVAENDPTFYEDFYGVIGEITSATGIMYFDYSKDERFSDDYSLFCDVDHLNREGARMFTELIMQEILNIN